MLTNACQELTVSKLTGQAFDFTDSAEPTREESAALMDANVTDSNITSSAFYSCYDKDLNGDELTPVRWVSPDSQSSLATGIVLLIYVVLGVPLSLFIIAGIVYKKLYQQPTHIIFMALVLNDLLVCFTYYPLNIVSGIAGEFIFGNDNATRCGVCMVGIMFVIFTHINVFYVSLLSLDRFLFIRFPLYYPRLVTVKSTTVAVVVIAIFCVVMSVPPLFGFGEIRFTHSISTCSIYLLASNPLSGIPNWQYVVFTIVLCLAGPVLLMVITNIWLICIVQDQIKKLYRTDKSDKKDSEKAREYDSTMKAKNKKQLQLVKVFGGILVVNLVSWFPDVLNVSVLLALNKQYFNIPHGFFVTNYLLFCSQVLLHPLLKVYLIPDIRQIASSHLAKKLRKRRATILLRSTSNNVFVSDKKAKCCGCFDKVSAALLYRNTRIPSENVTELSRVSVSSFKGART